MTLLDLTRELFTYLVMFRQRAVSADPPSLETVGEELEAIFRGMEERAAEQPLLGGPYQQVRHGLALLSDEVLLTSSWPQASAWARESLELRLFGGRQGGAGFFELLEAQQEAPKDVLAIHYLCLALGYCGPYAPDDPRLAIIKAGLLERLRAPLAPPLASAPAAGQRRPLVGRRLSVPEPPPQVPATVDEPPPSPPEAPAASPPRERAPSPPPEEKAAPPDEPAPALPAARPRAPAALAPQRQTARRWRGAVLAGGAAGLAVTLALWLAVAEWRGGEPALEARLAKNVPLAQPAVTPISAAGKEGPAPSAPADAGGASKPATATPQSGGPGPATTPPAPDKEASPPTVSEASAPAAPAAQADAPASTRQEASKGQEAVSLAASQPVAAAPKTPAIPAPPEPAPLPAAPPAPEAVQPPSIPSLLPSAAPAAPAPAPQARPGDYILHAGLYVGPIQSGRLAQRLKQAGLPAYVQQETRGDKVRYLVLVGPYGAEAPAQEALELIQRRFGIKPFFQEPPAAKAPSP